MASVIPAWTCSFRRSQGETRVAGDEGYLSLVSDGLIGGRKWLDGGGGAGREKREGGPREGGRRKAKKCNLATSQFTF